MDVQVHSVLSSTLAKHQLPVPRFYPSLTSRRLRECNNPSWCLPDVFRKQICLPLHWACYHQLSKVKVVGNIQYDMHIYILCIYIHTNKFGYIGCIATHSNINIYIYANTYTVYQIIYIYICTWHTWQPFPVKTAPWGTVDPFSSAGIQAFMPTGLAVGVRRRPDERRVATGRDTFDVSRIGKWCFLFESDVTLLLTNSMGDVVLRMMLHVFFPLDSVILVTPFWTNNAGPFSPHHWDRSSANI